MSRAAVRGVLALLLLAVSGCGGGDAEALPLCTAGDVVLTTEQTAHAATIAAVAKRLGLPNHAVTVALATAFQESGLRNLDHGDRDSLGLFQQRPSQGWGTPEELQDPPVAAARFYARLERVPGWATLPVTEAAQAVQRSAVPGGYAQWEHAGRELARALTGEEEAGLACRFRPRATPDPLSQGALRRAATRELGPGGLTRTRTSATAWTTASWLVAHAAQFGVSTVSLAGRTWTADRGTWEADEAASGLRWS